MAEESPILTELKKMVGREMVITGPEEVGRAAIRYFAQAIGDMNPLYLDEEYARGTRHGGIIAPLTLVCETMYYLVGDVDETGGPARRFGLPVGMEIRGANDYEFFQPFRPDDILTAHWKVTDVLQKKGRSGLLYFLQYDITYTNQRKELLAINHETLIFREKEGE
ncbi:MAG: MaoC family dehydratase N-terminal domain-containing protein [Dehalococcoidia bacterium]